MFAINHAATALVVKKAFPGVPIAALLISVQLVEVLWVFLNYVGVERTTTEEDVSTVKDVHLAYMPYSHSILTTVVLAAGAWIIIVLGFGSVAVGTAVAIGISSHIILDLISHARDIVIAPFRDGRKFGLGLYEAPAAAFLFEIGYGTFCWWLYGGGKALFWTIVLFNLANAPLFLKTLPGPERLLAHRPKWITTIVALQIVVTAVLVGAFS